eukprot:symbB.v1.2.000038.t1/scaffold12.1/size699752/18
MSKWKPTMALAIPAMLTGTAAWALAWWLYRRRRSRQAGPWLLRGASILDDMSPDGYRQVDVLLGTSGFIDLVSAGPILTPPGAQVIDCKEKLLMPGFVNAHTHSSQMLGRGLADPLPLDLWIFQMLAVTGAAMEKFGSRAKAAYVAALFCGNQTGRGQQWQWALHLFQEILLQSLLPDVIIYSAAISSCEKGLQWEVALSLFNSLEHRKVKPDLIIYSAAISACEKGLQWGLALDIFSSMLHSGLLPDTISYNAVISSCEKGLQWQVAILVFSRMFEQSIAPNVVTYNAVISSLEKCFMWQLAMDVFMRMSVHEIEQDVISYNSLISCCEKGSRWQIGLHYFDNMQLDLIRPDLVSYNALVSACEKDSQWELTTCLVHQIHQVELCPDVVTYSAIISSCQKGSQWQIGLQSFDAMRMSQIAPDVVCFNTAISSCEKGYQWQSAVHLLVMADMLWVFPDVISFSAVLTAISGGDNDNTWPLALEVFRMMTEKEVYSYNAVINSCQKGLQWQLALVFLECMDDDASVSPDMLSSSLKLRSSGWKVSEVLDDIATPSILRRNKNIRPLWRERSFTRAMNSIGKSKQWQQSLHLFHLMTQMVTPDLISYSVAISSCERGQQWQWALHLFQEILLQSLLPDVIIYSAAISSCEKGLQWEVALSLFNSLEHRKVKPDLIIYSAAISACEKGLQWGLALDIFSSMLHSGLLPDTITYNAVISSCEKGLQWQAAILVFSRMFEQSIAPNVVTYNAVISSLEKCFMWQLAMDVFMRMSVQQVEQDVISYNSLISCCEKGSQWQIGLHYFDNMQLDLIRPDLVSYNALVSACEKGSRWELVTHMLAVMRGTTDLLPDVVTFSALVAGSTWQRGLHFLDVTSSNAISLDVVCFNHAVTASAASWEVPLQLLRMMTLKILQPDVIGYSCTALQDHCFVLSFEEAEAACKAYKELGLRVFFAPMLNDDAVLYENYVPVSLDAQMRNARGETGGMGPEGQWRTEAGKSSETKCHASLKLWEECAQKLHDPANGVNIVIGPVSLYSCSAKLLEGAAELRKKYQLNGHTHVLESRGQKLEATRRFSAYGGSAVSFLKSTGFLNVPGTTTSLAHCCWLEEEEMQTIAASEAAVVHNPVSNLRLGSGICNVRRQLCNNVTVAMGVDGAMSSDGQAAGFPDRADFYAQSERDFAPFHHLSILDAQRAKNNCRAQGEACFVVQIYDNEIYISEEQQGFQSRNQLTMAMLQRVKAKFDLPDAEFVVDTSDGYSHMEAPIFVIAKFPSSPGGILYPDFSSYAWPESECPDEPKGSHVWARAVKRIDAALPEWSQKTDQLFWRGAATSSYRQQVVVGGANERQSVSSGSCVAIDAWCQHRYLVNVPGNTMALALKYRLLCGSVVITSPFIYHEWYYSQLKDGEHYVAVDLSWSSSEDLLSQLRTHPAVAQEIGMRAREWAKDYLTEDGFDSRASDAEMMDYARNTWLNVQTILSHRHFFIFAAEDPDVGMLGDADDILLVDCPHGYRQLMQKMVMAYRILLLRFDGVSYFLRADVDSVLPLNFLLPLLPQAAQGSAVLRRHDLANCEGFPPRWRMGSVGALQCQIECAMDRPCHFFQVNSFGDCATFADCLSSSESGPSAKLEVFQYGLRGQVGVSSDVAPDGKAKRRAFILGTILHGNEVLVNDTYNPQWNNLQYTQELGLTIYPPYPEASGYAMSADLAVFLSNVGMGVLENLQWKAWSIEDSALGTILAGLSFDMIQMPVEVREHVRDMTEALKLTCLLSPLTTVDYRHWLTTRETLRIASEGGYAAMGMHEGGKIAVGCVADVTLWDLTALSMLPRSDAASLLVLGRPQQGPLQAGSALHSSFIRGRRVVSEGLPMNCDLQRLRELLWKHSDFRRTGSVRNNGHHAAAEREYRGALGLDTKKSPWCSDASLLDLALKMTWSSYASSK